MDCGEDQVTVLNACRNVFYAHCLLQAGPVLYQYHQFHTLYMVSAYIFVRFAPYGTGWHD